MLLLQLVNRDFVTSTHVALPGAWPDFGGSTNGKIDGRHLPDAGFFNPCHPPESTKSTDIFSLGSIY